MPDLGKRNRERHTDWKLWMMLQMGDMNGNIYGRMRAPEIEEQQWH